MLTKNPIQIGSAFWPDSEKSRLGEYVRNRALFDGEHALIFPEFIESLRPEMRAQIWMVFGFHQLISTLWPDLLVGEAPQFTAADPAKQVFLDRLVAETSLVNVLYEIGIDVSRYGDGLFNIWFDGTQVHINTASPEIWLPWAAPADIKDIQGCVLGYKYKKDDHWYLDTRTHTPGFVQHILYEISDDGKIRKVVHADDTQETGVDALLVFPVHNVQTSDRYFGLSDYPIIDSICQEEESRLSQIKYVLDLNSSPNLKGPASMVTVDPAGKAHVPTSGKFMPLNPGEDVAYVEWSGQLDAAFKELADLQEKKFQLTGISPALFGGDFGRAESGSMMKRLLMSTLRKVNRLKMQFEPAIRQALSVASRLAVANNVDGAVELGIQDVHIFFQDGIPVDMTENASVYSTLKGAGLISIKTAVSMALEKGGTALEEELKNIGEDEQKAADEARAAAPAVPDQNAPLTDRLSAALKNGQTSKTA